MCVGGRFKQGDLTEKAMSEQSAEWSEEVEQETAGEVVWGGPQGSSTWPCWRDGEESGLGIQARKPGQAPGRH